jgi:hypothetical protein
MKHRTIFQWTIEAVTSSFFIITFYEDVIVPLLLQFQNSLCCRSIKLTLCILILCMELSVAHLIGCGTPALLSTV